MENCSCQQGFIIVQGDDTNALGNSIIFYLETDLDLTGYTAVFQVESLRYEWDDITSKELSLVFTREQTKTLEVGTYLGALKIYDENGLAATVIRNIPVNVLSEVVENIEPEPEIEEDLSL